MMSFLYLDSKVSSIIEEEDSVIHSSSRAQISSSQKMHDDFPSIEMKFLELTRNNQYVMIFCWCSYENLIHGIIGDSCFME